jgi:hypothetical protein
MRHWLRSRRHEEVPLDEAAWAPVAALLAATEEPKRTIDPFVAAGPVLAREAARRRAAATPRRLPWFRLMPLTAAVALLLISVSPPPAAGPEARVITLSGAEENPPSSVRSTAGQASPRPDDAACPTSTPLPEFPTARPVPSPDLYTARPVPSPTCVPELETGPR